MNKIERTEEIRHWEKTKDLVDQLIDVMVNYRQSGHPGGSRSKVQAMLALLLSGAMRWDIRHPEKRFGDRFVLGSGHVIPLIYATMAVLTEAMKAQHERTGNKKYLIPNMEERAVQGKDLLGFRRNKGLSGHAEMGGKTLFIKFNTGPSGHGAPAAAGEAVALRRAGAKDVKVFFMDGEGGMTPGGVHETLNSAWGLGLSNLIALADWNDFGIDEHSVSAVVPGTPQDWFSCKDWRVEGVEDGCDFNALATALNKLTDVKADELRPGAMWFKTRKGRGYRKFDAASHGAPHAINCALFWETKMEFAEKYGAKFSNFGCEIPKDPIARDKEFADNIEVILNVLREDLPLVKYLADRMVELGDSIPEKIKGFKLEGTDGFNEDPVVFDYKKYPADIYKAPGAKAPNREALGKWGSWVNAYGAKKYNRPLFLVSSADLSGSTNIKGFADGYDDFKGYGWYQRVGTEDGVLLPQEITEFTNSGISAGIATVNFSKTPEDNFNGFWAACSTYGSFSYLKYGLMRLFSQLAQDCELKVGKFMYVAGHSGPETADDSRTHFGVFSPGVTQLFPKGKVLNLYPWEYNEVPVMIGKALSLDTPLIALHLTRPAVEIPDRKKLGMPSHFEAARGAYVMRDYKDPKAKKDGTIIVQGTSAVANLVKALPEIDASKWNIKLVVATSPELFALQSKSYRDKVLSESDKANSTFITTGARMLMSDWDFNPLAKDYAMSSDWDDNWRTGGTVDEVIDEAHLSKPWLLKGIKKFVDARDARLAKLRAALE
ncbi:MAG TPA: hypothetical protein PKD55_07315 [Bellilinea sp.]|nr:hypothetical protein [Bellilinea sp.]